MSKLIRFEEILINYEDIIWVGVTQNVNLEVMLSFHFTNPVNNFTLKYPDRVTASSALTTFDSIVKSAIIFPLVPQQIPPLPPRSSS